MFLQILDKNQKALLPGFHFTNRRFYLVGGTSLGLQIGHRRSIDFDFFTDRKLSLKVIDNNLSNRLKDRVIVKNEKNYTLVYNQVKLTFFHYPFNLSKYYIQLHKNIRSVDILTIAAMKAYALGRRAKWKDYVDLYFVLHQFGIKDISNRAKDIFGEQYNEMLFRKQLGYFADIDYSEKVDYIAEPVPDEEVREFLIKEAVRL